MDVDEPVDADGGEDLGNGITVDRRPAQFTLACSRVGWGVRCRGGNDDGQLGRNYDNPSTLGRA